MRNAVLVLGLTVVVFFSLITGKWNSTAPREPIDPQRGIYGMEEGLETWTEMNARMPENGAATPYEGAKGRRCTAINRCRRTVASRALARSKTKLPVDPLWMPLRGQALEGLDAVQSAALKTRFETKMAASIMPEEIAGMNDFDQTLM